MTPPETSDSYSSPFFAAFFLPLRHPVWQCEGLWGDTLTAQRADMQPDYCRVVTSSSNRHFVKVGMAGHGLQGDPYSEVVRVDFFFVFFFFGGVACQGVSVYIGL